MKHDTGIKTSASLSIQFDNPFSPFPGRDYMRGLQWIKDCGFDGVELIISDPNLIDVSKIEKAISSMGLEVSTIATGQASALEGLFMASPAEYIREAAFKRICDVIDFSVRLGKPNVTVGLIRDTGGAPVNEWSTFILKRELLRAAEYAMKKGVVINLEPINRFECKLLNTTESVYTLLNEIGNPENIGILFDTFHSNIQDSNVITALENAMDKLVHVHFSDNNRRLPGEGHIDFEGVYKCLKSNNYKGYISLEVLNIPDSRHIIEYAGDRMKPYMSGH